MARTRSNQPRTEAVPSPAAAARSFPSPRAGEEPLIPDHVARFLARIPTTTDTVEWQEKFSWALHELLGDVDFVALSADSHMVNPYLERDEEFSIINDNMAGDGQIGAVRVWTSRDGGRAAFLCDGMRRNGIPVEEAHPPTCFEYQDDNGHFLAMLVFLRHRSKPPISARTLAAMESLRPFLCSLFVNFNRRRAVERPAERLCNDVFNDILNDLDLPLSSGVVLSLQLYGCTHREMAEILHISKHAVAERIRRLYRIAGCHNAMELFGRYLQRRQERAGEQPERQEAGSRIVAVM